MRSSPSVKDYINQYDRKTVVACLHPLSLNIMSNTCIFLAKFIQHVNHLVTDISIVLLMATVSDDLKPLSVDPTKPGKLRVVALMMNNYQ